MPTLFAQPYNIDATGFYFDTFGDYQDGVKNCFDTFGFPVEEFEIQFIDGDDLDYQLYRAWGVYQSNIEPYLQAVDDLDDHTKIALIAMSECGYDIDENTDTDDVTIYYCDTLKDLAFQFVEEGVFGTIPKSLEPYIDYDAIARDLGFDYSELTLADQIIIFRCP